MTHEIWYAIKQRNQTKQRFIWEYLFYSMVDLIFWQKSTHIDNNRLQKQQNNHFFKNSEFPIVYFF